MLANRALANQEISMSGRDRCCARTTIAGNGTDDRAKRLPPRPLATLAVFDNPRTSRLDLMVDVLRRALQPRGQAALLPVRMLDPRRPPSGGTSRRTQRSTIATWPDAWPYPATARCAHCIASMTGL
jgi:hypothetical protein